MFVSKAILNIITIIITRNIKPVSYAAPFMIFRNPEGSCSYVSHHYRSHCSQVYNYHRLLSWDKGRGLHMDIYKVCIYVHGPYLFVWFLYCLTKITMAFRPIIYVSISTGSDVLLLSYQRICLCLSASSKRKTVATSSNLKTNAGNITIIIEINIPVCLKNNTNY